jgi:hypothetical protein
VTSASSIPLSAGIQPVDGTNQTLFGGQAATAQNVYVDLSQLEVGVFPTSAIFVPSSSPVVRATDALSFSTAEYPTSFITKGFTFTWAPVCSSAEMVSAGLAQTLFGVNTGTNVFRFQPNQSTCYLFVAGSPIGNTNSLTFSRNQLMTFTINFVAGTIVVAGATTGNGTTNFTPTTWPTGSAFVVSNSTNPSFGRFGTTITSL